MDTNKKIKIACYGLVRKDAGSGVGAQYLLLEELLQRGFKIDFYNRKEIKTRCQTKNIW